MGSVAILLSGELRFRDEVHFNKIKNLLSKYDVYISTYYRYENICKQLTNNYIFTDSKLPQGNMYQWLHLDNIIKKWKSVLLNYDFIVKIRTDIEYNDFSIDDLDISQNTIYPQTDQIFYGTSTDFINCYENMFDNVIGLYHKKSQHHYIDVNYENILKSDSESDVKAGWLTLPKIIYGKTLYEIQNNIKKYDIDWLTNNSEHLEMEFGQKTGYAFTSERCFLIQTLNKSKLGKSQIFGKLMENRKEFNYLSYE